MLQQYSTQPAHTLPISLPGFQSKTTRILKSSHIFAIFQVSLYLYTQTMPSHPLPLLKFMTLSNSRASALLDNFRPWCWPILWSWTWHWPWLWRKKFDVAQGSFYPLHFCNYLQMWLYCATQILPPGQLGPYPQIETPNTTSLPFLLLLLLVTL